jgi:hypothetical protein
MWMDRRGGKEERREEKRKEEKRKLWALQDNGCTALGPALLLSILIVVCKWMDRREEERRGEKRREKRR